MINFDIVFVTYNSEKWIKKCVDSIVASEYDLKKVGLYFYDCCSSDKTVSLLEKTKNDKKDVFGTFEVICGNKNVGFGRANNKAFSYTKAPYVFFLNIDCEIFPDTLLKLSEEIKNNKDNNIGLWELRQLPYEHPKYYDPYTCYSNWASGACFVMKREVFKKIKGFDKNIFLYCEDLELSWRLRKLGFVLKYLYNVPIVHHSYLDNKFKINQFVYSITNNIYIRYKYGTIRNVLGGYRLFLSVWRGLKTNNDLKDFCLKDIKKRILKEEIKMSFLGMVEFVSRIKFLFKKNISFKPRFVGFDYEASKQGAFYECKKIEGKLPLVSIIVRTCGRPDYLRETLTSIRNQTYSNIEVVVVEDGKSISNKMIKEEFYDMNIKYFSTGKKAGRCRVGNIALENSSGEYINFLDDDDLFYPEHVEVLVSELLNGKEKVVYNSAFETPVYVISKEPYVYSVEDIVKRYNLEFNYLDLMYSNITPIQAVMFSRDVYLECGGFDENMDALEDWDLWIRYALKFPFRYVDKTTSLYRVPADKKEILRRSEFLTEPLNEVRNRYKDKELNIKVSDFYDYLQIDNVNCQNVRKQNIIKRIVKKVIKTILRMEK